MIVNLYILTILPTVSSKSMRWTIVRAFDTVLQHSKRSGGYAFHLITAWKASSCLKFHSSARWTLDVAIMRRLNKSWTESIWLDGTVYYYISANRKNLNSRDIRQCLCVLWSWWALAHETVRQMRTIFVISFAVAGIQAEMIVRLSSRVDFLFSFFRWRTRQTRKSIHRSSLITFSHLLTQFDCSSLRINLSLTSQTIAFYKQRIGE